MAQSRQGIEQFLRCVDLVAHDRQVHISCVDRILKTTTREGFGSVNTVAITGRRTVLKSLVATNICIHSKEISLTAPLA